MSGLSRSAQCVLLKKCSFYMPAASSYIDHVNFYCLFTKHKKKFKMHLSSFSQFH